MSKRNHSVIYAKQTAIIIFTQPNTNLIHIRRYKYICIWKLRFYFKSIFINFIGAVGNEEEGSTEDKDAADEEEQERLEALREAEERRKEKHRKMEEEREKMRQEIRDKVIIIPIFFY